MNLYHKFIPKGLQIMLLLISSLEVLAQTSTIYVSNNGNDSNIGTKNKPLKTIEAAVRRVTSGNATIFIREGFYNVNNTMKIPSTITLTAYNNERVEVSGGKIIDTNKLIIVKDTTKYLRLPKKSLGKVWTINLKDQGIENWGELNQTGYDSRKVSAPLELFINQKPLNLARWPNDSTIPISKVIEIGSTRTSKSKASTPAFVYNSDKKILWSNASDIWIAGIFAVGWAYDNLAVDRLNPSSKTIYTKNNASYGIYSNSDTSEGTIKAARDVRGFYFYNVLEELDEPGEWYLDRLTGDLYFWPEDPIDNAIVIVSISNEPLIKLDNVSNVTIKNILFTATRHSFVQINNCNKINFESCSFVNSGLQAIEAINSKNIKIINSTIAHTGAGGITIGGGNRRSLESSQNLIQNCEFYDYSRLYKSYTPAINLNGVGTTVANCYIHDTPDQAIIFSGNDHVIRNNRIENVCYGFSDMGGIYTGRDPSSTGTSITNNLFKNINNIHSNMIAAVYMDDGSGGINVSNNIFENCGSNTESGFGGIHINGGANNLLKNNVFINCQIAYSNSPWSDRKWNDMYLKNPHYIKQLTETVDIRSQKYITRYPYLKNFFDSTSQNYRKNFINNTICYNVGKLKTGSGYEAVDTYVSTINPYEFAILTYQQPKNFTRKTIDKNIPEEIKKWIGWKPINSKEIGLLP